MTVSFWQEQHPGRMELEKPAGVAGAQEFSCQVKLE